MVDKRTHIRNGRIIDPSQGIDGYGDLIVEDGLIAEVFIKGAETPRKKQSASALIPGVKGPSMLGECL